MHKLQFSVFRYTPALNVVNQTGVGYGFADADRTANTPVHHAIWSLMDSKLLNDQPVGAGKGMYVSNNNNVIISAENAVCLRFEVTHLGAKPITQQERFCVARQEFEWPENKAVLRLDQVTFPPGAIAYRHTHAGAGFRHLVKGELNIESDHHAQNMTVGDSWFEDANSPVRAVAGEGDYTHVSSGRNALQAEPERIHSH